MAKNLWREMPNAETQIRHCRELGTGIDLILFKCVSHWTVSLRFSHRHRGWIDGSVVLGYVVGQENIAKRGATTLAKRFIRKIQQLEPRI